MFNKKRNRLPGSKMIKIPEIREISAGLHPIMLKNEHY